MIFIEFFQFFLNQNPKILIQNQRNYEQFNRQMCKNLSYYGLIEEILRQSQIKISL